MEEWKEYKLKDIIQFNPLERIPKGTKCRKIGMDQLSPFCRYVYSNNYDLYKGGTKFRNGDTIMARITPCLENGKTAYVSSLGDDEVAFGSTEFIVMRKIENVSDSKFIYYLSISPTIRDIAIKSMIGSSGRQRVQQDVLENLKMKLPSSLDDQIRIANILSSLDDKIELNNRINANLEEQAQALFRRWFVDFEFPNEQGLPYKSNGGKFIDSELGKIPNGWNVRKLSDISRYNNERINTNELNLGNYISTENMLPNKNGITRASNVPVNTNVTNYKEGDILLSNIRPYFKKIWLSSKTGGCSNDVLNFRTKKAIIPFVYNLIFQDIFFDYIMTGANGSKMPRGNKIHIMDYIFAMPSTMCLIIKYCELINPFIQKIKQIENENNYLSQLRESLLPRLMNNQIKI